jgi:starch phosphorylase
MKAAMRSICPIFNTNRMVHEYAERFYLPSAERYQRLAEDSMVRARALADWKSKVRKHWPEIRVESVEADTPDELQVGDELEVRARVHLGPLEPQDVAVELYQGLLDGKRQILGSEVITMSCMQSDGDGSHLFVGAIPCRTSGLHGYALRILPQHEDLSNPYEPGLILWTD